MGLGDLGAVEFSGFQTFEVAEVVDVNFAVDFGCVEFSAAFPEHGSFVAFSFGQHNEFAADPVLLGALRYFLLQLHQLSFAGFDGVFGNLAIERVRF